VRLSRMIGFHENDPFESSFSIATFTTITPGNSTVIVKNIASAHNQKRPPRRRSLATFVGSRLPQMW
jgi:hypothetical protein